MDKEIKAKWIKALRSGRYKQGTRALYHDGAYCCLGVLAKVVTGKNPDAKYWTDQNQHVANMIAQIDPMAETEFVKMNDQEGVPFEMIAGLIDSAL